MVGHFPVLFQSKDENSFTVDKPEQAKIMERVGAVLRLCGFVSMALCSWNLGYALTFDQEGYNPNPKHAAAPPADSVCEEGLFYEPNDSDCSVVLRKGFFQVW